ncbi:MAG: hypothetical protein C0399_06745 [Syntrophus sp. (in: bacteria)]|nr:hypothetical protein [Syntrophus sp. (in: bacteria)]
MKSDQTLIYLAHIGYSNALALSILLRKTAKTAKTANSECERIFKRLLKSHLIVIIPDKYGNQGYSRKAFVQPTKRGFEYCNIVKKRKAFKYPKDEEHEQMRIDVLTAFYKAYSEDCEIKITYPDIGGYKPDALIKLTFLNYSGQKTIILEVETGTRSIGTIVKEKLEKMKTVDLKTHGYKDAIFLIVLSCKEFNKFDRDMEFKPHLVKKVKENLGKLLKASDLPGNFLFMAHSDYPLIYRKPYKAYTVDSKGQPKSIIHN